MTAALLDRLTHHCAILETNGESDLLRIAELLAQGHETGVAAGLASVTAGRVVQARREWADSWLAFQAQAVAVGARLKSPGSCCPTKGTLPMGARK